MKNLKYIFSIILSLTTFQVSADYKIIFNKLEGIPEYSKTPEEIISEYNNEWITFFETNCNNPFINESDLETSGNSVTCRSMGLNDEDLPQGGLKKTAAWFNFSSNNLQDLSAFKDIEKGNYFNFSGNPITKVSNLSSLRDINTLSLYNTSISNLNGLENATRINILDLRLNSNLEDITALENVEMTRLSMDSAFFEQTDLAKMPSNSLFCENLKSGSGYVTLDGAISSNIAAVFGKICDLTPEEEAANAGEWLYFLSSKCDGRYKNLSELETGTNTIKCNNNFTDIDLPQGGLQESASYFNFKYNDLQTLSSFVDVEKAHVLDFGNNNINSLANLANLQNATNLLIYGNPNITDLSPISNANINRLYIDESQINNLVSKLPQSSAFCQNLSNNVGYLYVMSPSGNGIREDLESSVCNF